MQTTTTRTWKEIAMQRQERVQELLLENQQLRKQIAEFKYPQSDIEQWKRRVELGRERIRGLKKLVKALKEELINKTKIVREYKKDLIDLKKQNETVRKELDILKEEEIKFRNELNFFFRDWKCNFKTMRKRLERLQNRWNIRIPHMGDIVSMHFVTWGEHWMRYIYNYIVPQPGDGDKNDKGGLNDMIKRLDKKGYFRDPCPLKPYVEGPCKGCCEIPCCGAYKRKLFHTWRSQRNLRVHWILIERRKLMNANEMEDLIDKIEEILEGWRIEIGLNTSSDDDDDDDE